MIVNHALPCSLPIFVPIFCRSSAVAAVVTESAGSDAELYELRRKKLRLECTKLEIEVERLPLECAKLELQIQQLQRELLSNHNTM